MYQYATTSKALLRQAWDDSVYDEPVPDRELIPVPPRGAGWSLISTAANARTLFWTWRRSTRATAKRKKGNR